MLPIATLNPDPLTAPLVTHILTEYSKGIYTQREIAAVAAKTGLVGRTNKPITFQTVSKILHNGVYAGLVNTRLIEEPAKGLHPPLITLEMYQRNQLILSGKKPAIDSYVINNPDYPLRRFVSCTKCGNPLRGSAPTGKKKRYPKYNCSTCKKSSVDRDSMHEEYLVVLEGIQPKPGTLRVFREILMRQWRDKSTELDRERKSIETEIETLEQRKRSLRDKYADGELSNADRLEYVGDISDQIRQAQERLSKLISQTADVEGEVDYLINFMGNLPKLWKDASVELQQRLQRAIMPEGLIINSAWVLETQN